MRCYCLLLALVFFTTLGAQDYTEHHEPDAPYPYLQALPSGFDADSGERYPLIIFLHGAGERGTDLSKVAKHGPFLEMDQGRELDAIVIGPQMPSSDSSWDAIDTLSLLKHLFTRYHCIDGERITMTGLSMGGYGCYTYLNSNPGRYVNAYAICCGSGAPSGPLTAQADSKVWHFQAWDDTQVTYAENQALINALADGRSSSNVLALLSNYPHQDNDTELPATDTMTAHFDDNSETWTWVIGQSASASASLQYTMYPSGGHLGGWKDAYDDQQLWDWLLAQQKTFPTNPHPNSPFASGLPSSWPARVQGEDFDLGGKGVAWYDQSDGNAGGAYRNDVDVDIYSLGSGYNIGGVQPHEWLSYTIEIPADGDYRFSMRASVGRTSTLHLQIAGVRASASASPDLTGHWNTYHVFDDLITVALPQGRHQLRIWPEQAGYNLDWFELEPVDAPGAITRHLNLGSIDGEPYPLQLDVDDQERYNDAADGHVLPGYDAAKDAVLRFIPDGES